MGFVLSCTIQVTHADELVFSDLIWGAPKENGDLIHECGLINYKRWWSQTDIWFAVVAQMQASIVCEIRDGRIYPKNLALSLLDPEATRYKVKMPKILAVSIPDPDNIKMDNWEKTIEIDTGYFDFTYRQFDLALKDKNSRKCFAFGQHSYAIINTYFLIEGVYCGKDQSEIAFKEALKTLRLESQKPLKSPTVIAKKSPEPQVKKTKPSPKTGTSGSGFFASRLGHVITNQHIVSDCKKSNHWRQLQETGHCHCYGNRQKKRPRTSSNIKYANGICRNQVPHSENWGSRWSHWQRTV